MKKILRPAIKLMNNLTFNQKFTSISIFLILSIAAMALYFITTTNERIDFNAKERDGVAYNASVKNLMIHLQKHRETSYQLLNGQTSKRKTLANLQNEIAKDIETIDSIDKKLNVRLKVENFWITPKNAWQDLKEDVLTLTPEESNKRHTEVIESIQKLHTRINDQSNLILDPDLDSFYCMDVTMTRQLPLSEKLAAASNMAVGLASKPVFSRDERNKLLYLYVEIKLLSDAVNANMQTAFNENKDNSLEKYRKYVEESIKTNNNFLNLIKSKMIDIETVKVQPQAISDGASNALDSNAILYDKVSEGLDSLIKVRVDKFVKDNYLVTIFALFLSILIVYLNLAFSKSVMYSMDTLKNATVKMVEGDFTVIIKMDTKDEFKDIAQLINEIADSYRKIIKVNREISDQIAASSQEMSAITEQIASSSQNQYAASEETLSSMEQLDASIQNIAKNVQEVTINIFGVTNMLGNMDKSLENVSLSILQVNNEALNTIRTTESGSLAVEKSQDGMNKINNTVGNLVSVLKSLGKSAIDIEEIVNVIDNIANQTNLLALNAAIEAARAGEHGRGFSVVSSAIRDLSEKSSEATKNITKLIRNIQEEIIEAVETSKEGFVQVTSGVELANETQKALAKIKEAVESTAIEVKKVMVLTEEQSETVKQIVTSAESVNDLSQTMSATIEEQTAASTEVVKAVESVSQSSNQIATGTNEIASSTENLAKEAQKLSSIISKYKI